MKKLLIVLPIFLLTAVASLGVMFWTEMLSWEDFQKKLGWAQAQEDSPDRKAGDETDADKAGPDAKPDAPKASPVSEEKALSAVAHMQQLMARMEKERETLLALQEAIQKQQGAVKNIQGSIVSLANALLADPEGGTPALTRADFSDAPKIAKVVTALENRKKKKDTFPKWVESVTKMEPKEAAKLVAQLEVPTAAALMLAITNDDRVKILEEMEAEKSGAIVKWTLYGEAAEKGKGKGRP